MNETHDNLYAFVRLMSRIVDVEFVVLLGFLVFLCVRTRSKGLICVTAGIPLTKPIYVVSHIIGVFRKVVNGGHTWTPDLDVRGVKLYQGLEIAMITGCIEVVFGYGLCLLGAFLIYKEWQQAKFRHPEP